MPTDQVTVKAFVCEASAVESGPGWRPISLTLDELCDQSRGQDTSLLVFIDTAAVASPDSFAARRRLSSAFGIPPHFWTSLCKDASGFFWSSAHQSPHGQRKHYVQAFRFLIKQGVDTTAELDSTRLAYHWDRLGFVMCWQPQGHLILLCFDLPDSLEQQICHGLGGGETVQHGHGPFSLHPTLLMHVVQSFDRAVWSWRDVVRQIEKSRAMGSSVSTHNFVHMHETARHVLHCSEMLTTALSVLESMTREVGACNVETCGSKLSAVVRDLDFCHSLLTSLLHRSSVLEKRLQNEINLAFNLDAQHSSRATGRIAELAQRDGEITKGIGYLGMVFLPGTLVSAIFSMSFFDSSGGADGQPQRLTVSNQFWLYWATAVPLTAVTLVSWHLWQRGYIRKRASAVQYQHITGNPNGQGRALLGA